MIRPASILPVFGLHPDSRPVLRRESDLGVAVKNDLPNPQHICHHGGNRASPSFAGYRP